ncbi:MAG TPA: hypothetical protein VN310_07460 [Candidatus Dormibacteraeota bacterium]|nr:hypothetical protein [Candidatus Dormibacteraeota bacterium]
MIRGMIRGIIVKLALVVIFVLAGPCDGQDQATLWSIAHVLRSGHLSGSMEYWGSCGDEKELVTRRLPIATTPTNSSAPPLQVLREMFANDGDMQVTQEPDGTIRLVEKTVPQDLLNVKIVHISFDDEQKKHHTMHFHTLVLDFITEAPDVQAFMKDHSIGREPKVINQAMSAHPSFSGELDNVTLAQTLDYMVKTFRGLWVYKECPGNKENKRIVDFSFYNTE